MLTKAFFYNSLTFITVLAIIIYAVLQIMKKQINCSGIRGISKPTLSGIGTNDPRFNNKLFDYYIKSSFNSCASGNFVNDWVDMCALTSVIQQGYRLLDFEVYDLHQTAIVSTSDSDNYSMKGTYNFLKLDDVLKHVADHAISNSMVTDECPNASDPLFLHFRIKSNHISIYNSIANSIGAHFGKYLLSNEYSYENKGLNLGNIPLKTLLQKVIIIVDKTNSNLEASKLNEYVNIAGKSVFLRVLSFNDVVHNPDMDELIDYNRTNMTLCTPNNSNNYNTSISMQYGVQFSCVNSQKNDVLVQASNENFKEFAFTLKPDSLRKKQEVIVKEPAPPDMQQSYGYKTHKTSYYEFNL
jgi:hypothetical protein